MNKPLKLGRKAKTSNKYTSYAECIFDLFNTNGLNVIIKQQIQDKFNNKNTFFTNVELQKSIYKKIDLFYYGKINFEEICADIKKLCDRYAEK